MINEGLGRRDAAVSDYREAVKRGLTEDDARIARGNLNRLGDAP
jgi:hypothetical protein